ncbi:MAG: phenylalanine--tRNA ligase subunit beta [Wolbachia endosymbiont of Menacanthus eurysternus]|nr:MAG: phenylalanine--tRNA ligase subunit beta [Wolbachia endosymbiont of Menacanthus eurysternus]
MKFTLSWLLEYLETNASLEEIIDKLTHIGLEVENVVDNTKLGGFLVVRILDIMSHPGSDRLKLCQVDNGSRLLQVVCSASNIKRNMKTVLAPIGSRFPESNFLIESKSIQGILSEGMFCSTSETAFLQEESEEIIELFDDYQVGDRFFSHDYVIDINITPNRGDCLSVWGIARDLSATGIGRLKVLNIPKLVHSVNSPINVKVLDKESFISGIYITNLKNTKSPKWLKDRLQLIGLQCISTIVDIINYIMISFGRPLHIYDAKKIEGELIVRKANSGEKFIDLNNKEHLLNNDINVVSDKRNIHAIAGIIGGKFSECTAETTDIFLESAWFNSISITKSSKQLGISTNSSRRFSRSVDPGFIIDGLNLATCMILELCGGEVSSIISSGSLDTVNNVKVNFNYKDINRFGSISISPDESFNILSKLGFKIDRKIENNWSVQVPSWRPDIAIPADLIEEVVRIYGFDKIKEEPLIGNIEIETSLYDDLRILMTSRGFHEVFTWSFTSEFIAEKFGYSDKLFIIDNPFKKNLNIMRPSVIPSLLQIATNNISHGISDLAIFEIGPVYNSIDHPKYILSGIRSGNNLPRNHYNSNRISDIFDVKADILIALEFLNIDCDILTIERAKKKYYHPGKSGTLSFKNKITIGHFGELDSSILDIFDIKQKVVSFEIILENIIDLPINRKKFINYKYRGVKRDFAFIVNKNIAAGNIINTIKESSDLITEVLVFDIYHGDDLGSDKISIALSVIFRSPTHTLTEEEIRRESNAIINLMHKSVGGILRY